MRIQAINGSASSYPDTFEPNQPIPLDETAHHEEIHAKLHELDELTIALRVRLYGLSVQ